MKKSFKGFTLAEMMVVMLVLTILLAAAAPIMTKRKAGGASDQPWKYSINNTDAYFGLANNQTAMIGQDAKTDKDLSARLILTGNSDNPYITFKSAGNNTVANMFFKSSNFIIGGPYDADNKFQMGGPATNNVGLGKDVLKNNTSGSDNVAIGSNALLNNTEGYNNIAIGRSAMYKNTSVDNIAIGLYAMENKTLGSRNIAIGNNAMKQTHYTGGEQLSYEHITDNVAIGHNALNGLYGHTYSGPTAMKNIAIGTNALSDTRNWGSKNIGIGHSALKTNVQGDSNVAIGTEAMYKNESGDGNTALGYSALSENTEGTYHTAVGYQAAYDMKETGGYVTAIGYKSGSNDKNTTDYNHHLYLGSPSNHNYIYTKGMIEGHHHGDKKYIVLNGDVLITGNLLVNSSVYATGLKSDYWGKASSSETIYSPGSYLFPERLQTHPSTFYKDINTPITDWLFTEYTNMTCRTAAICPFYSPYYPTSSDKRLKNIKGENKAGLEEVKKLNVFDFTFKKDDKKIPHVGVIAQDLKKIFPNAVVEGEDGYLQIRHEDMFYAVINAIKQLDKVIEALIAEVKVDLAKILKHDEDIAKLQKQNNEIVKQNKELQNKNEELEKRIDNLEKRLEKVLKELDED